MQDFDVWKLLAGLGMFLFGMHQMEDSVKKLSGRAFKKLIRRYTTGKFKSIFSGVFVTSVLQSSSAVSLMILAFVGAGVMSMENAIGVMLGSNIGTTITAWIVATLGFKIKIATFSLPMVGLGGVGLVFFADSEKLSNTSKLLAGFGFLFLGLDYMKESVDVFTSTFNISSLPDYGLIVYLLVGALLTALMQSSSASLAVVLTALNAQIIDFNASAAMVVGANVGTTVTVLLGSIGGVQAKKRVAYSHFTFNIITGIVAMLLLPALSYLVLNIFGAKENAVVGIALFHTVFNVLGVVIFLPFIGVLARVLNRLFPDRIADFSLFIANATVDVPEAAIVALQKETMHLVDDVLRFNLRILNIDEQLVFSNYTYAVAGSKPKNLSIDQAYLNLKLLQVQIFTFATKIQAQELNEADSTDLAKCLHSARMALHSAKTIKDIRTDFDAFENADNVFFNEQYTQFRKRQIATYLRIDRIIQPNQTINKAEAIIKSLHRLQEEDQLFVTQTTHAISVHKIKDVNVANALLANRAFVQSSRQILLAIEELIVHSEETEIDREMLTEGE